MFYCSKCGNLLKLIGEVKDIRGNTILIFQCSWCNKVIYVEV